MAILIGAVSTQDRQRIEAAGYTIIDQAPAGVALALQDGEVPITVIVDCEVIDLLNPDDHIARVSTEQVIGVAQSLGITVDEAAAARIAARVSAHLSEAAAGEIVRTLASDTRSTHNSIPGLGSLPKPGSTTSRRQTK